MHTRYVSFKERAKDGNSVIITTKCDCKLGEKYKDTTEYRCSLQVDSEPKEIDLNVEI